MQVRAFYTTKEICEMTGLSRHQVLRMKRRHGWGRVVFLGQLREMDQLWSAIVLREQLSA
jgi:uncharacterized protein YjcR